MTDVLSPEQMELWNGDGFLKLEGFLSDHEVADLSRWVEEIESTNAEASDLMHHFEKTPAGIRPSRTENFIACHDGLKALLTCGKVRAVVSALLGENAVVYKEKINYKYPGGGGYVAHQDAPAYEFISYHVTCLIAVDPATTTSGCLHFAPGLHRRGLIDLDASGCIAPAAAAAMTWVPVPTQPGDVLCFGSYVPHYSGANRTERARRIIYVTYNARSVGDFRERYYADKRRTFARYAASGTEHAGLISKIGHFQGKTVVR